MNYSKVKLFVALGTQKFPFDRLVSELNKMITDELYEAEDIVIQSTKYGEVTPLCTSYGTIPVEEFNDLMDSAEVVITHSGVNSILSGMERRKPLVIVPRISKYGEHVDDHQLEIAKVMEERYNVLVVKDMTNLRDAIKQAKTHQYLPYISQRSRLISAVQHIINEM